MTRAEFFSGPSPRYEDAIRPLAEQPRPPLAAAIDALRQQAASLDDAISQLNQRLAPLSSNAPEPPKTSTQSGRERAGPGSSSVVIEILGLHDTLCLLTERVNTQLRLLEA